MELDRRFTVLVLFEWRTDEVLLLSLEQFTMRMRAPSLSTTDWYLGRDSLACSRIGLGLVLFRALDSPTCDSDKKGSVPFRLEDRSHAKDSEERRLTRSSDADREERDR